MSVENCQQIRTKIRWEKLTYWAENNDYDAITGPLCDCTLWCNQSEATLITGLLGKERGILWAQEQISNTKMFHKCQ